MCGSNIPLLPAAWLGGVGHGIMAAADGDGAASVSDVCEKDGLVDDTVRLQ